MMLVTVRINKYQQITGEEKEQLRARRRNNYGPVEGTITGCRRRNNYESLIGRNINNTNGLEVLLSYLREDSNQIQFRHEGFV